MKRNKTTAIWITGVAIVLVIFMIGAIWSGRTAQKDTENAVHSVSLLYLDELAGRREQVVAKNLDDRIYDMRTALELMSDEDLTDDEHLRAYQSRMKQLFRLEKFAFVDSGGLIYTSKGTQDNIDDYNFEYNDLKYSEISLKDVGTDDMKVIIATPVRLKYTGKKLVACFMEINMKEMLSGVSMEAEEGGATFCNLYTSGGIALSNTVLGGLADEDNLFQALEKADVEGGVTAVKVAEDFEQGNKGVVSFTYDGIKETLAYVPVEGTDWQLTYLIRESVISDQISAISRGIITRNVTQSILALLALLAMSAYMIVQTRRNAALTLEKETAETANRIKHDELEQRLELQDKLLEEEKKRTQQDQMITAMASDYRVVYHVDLDRNEAICYRADPDDPDHMSEGIHFPYMQRFTYYANHNVAEQYREGFLQFIEPDNIRKGLETEEILAYRYLVRRRDSEYYEMIRVAGVRHAADRTDHKVHAIGLGLTVIDAEMRQAMEQQQALSDALAAAEEANKAKTAFLSNMSHEIRTPMNAIIGIDSIALKEPGLSDRTIDNFEKIGASARHLLSLINDILDMSRIESGRMVIRNEEFSFSDMLEQINTIIRSQCVDKGLNYEFRTEGQIREYYIGDDMKLKQVLINILGNAVKFTPADGTVSFIVECIANFEKQSTLRFTMKDTGIGMDKEFLPKVFEAFAQENSGTSNKYGSTGLGMAITKNIVELMNGNITVDSEKGKGSTFTVTVTLRDSDRVVNSFNDVEPHDLKVLVIDDDPIALEHAHTVLEELGIAADTAGGGKEAVELIQLKTARRENYNLIFVDMKMPDQDGIEVTRQIRQIIGADSAVMVLTAYSWDDIEDEAKEAGVDSFLPKPLYADDVMAAFKKAMARKQDAQESRVEADLTGRRMLVAEDMDINAEILMDLLEMEDMESERAENGQIAVDMFKASEPGYYDAVLMDMRMPVMDGLSAAKTIRGLDRPDARTIPIIALTANAFDEDVQRSLQAGMNAHLSKPIEPDHLFSTLRELIRD